MDNMRADVRHLDSEDARKDIPVTHEEMADNFSKFCLSDNVQTLVSGQHLYNDFVDQHRIVLLLQVGRKVADRALLSVCLWAALCSKNPFLLAPCCSRPHLQISRHNGKVSDKTGILIVCSPSTTHPPLRL